MLAFRSLDPFRALREPDRRRRDEERLSRSEQRTLSKTQNNHLTGKAPYKSAANFRAYADNTEHLATAFDSLYASLTDTQKQAADTLFRQQATAAAQSKDRR